MSEQEGSLIPSAGWSVVHWFYRIDRARWRTLGTSERTAAIAEFAGCLSRQADVEGLQRAPFAGVTKYDLGFVAVHPDLWQVQRLAQEVAATALGACLVPVFSFLSLTEASEYITDEVDWARLLIKEEQLDPASPEFAARFASLRKRTTMYAEGTAGCRQLVSAELRATQALHDRARRGRPALRRPHNPAHHHLHRHR
jgi:peroxiredoxin